MKPRFLKRHKFLSISAGASLLLTTACCATAIVKTLVTDPIYRREIPPELLKLSDDKTILYGFRDDVTILDIARQKYNVLVIPDTVTKIKESAFALMFDGKSSDISEVDIGPNVEEIGDNAFFKDWGIAKIVFNGDEQNPSQLKYIGNEAFSTCGIEGTLEFPSNLEHIGENAFYLCENLKRIKLPQSLKSVGHHAFAYDHTLGIIDLLNYDSIPEWMLNLSGCFYNIGSRLSSEESKNVLVNTRHNAVSEWQQAMVEKQKLPSSTSLVYTFIDNAKKVPEHFFKIERHEDKGNVDYILTGFEGDVSTWINDYDILEIPSQVTKINGGILKNKITAENGARCTLSLGSNITSIGSEAFSGCTGIEGTLNLSFALTTVGDNAFNNCRFTSVQMSPSLNDVGTRAFADNPALIECSIACDPQNPNFHNGQQFRNCPNLQFIDLTPIGTNLPQKLQDLTGNNVMFKSGEVATYGYLSISPDAGWIEILTSETGWNFSCYSDTNPDALWSNYNITEHLCDPEYLDIVKQDTIIKGMTQQGIDSLLTYDTIESPYTTETIVDNAFSGLFDRDLTYEQYRFWEFRLNDGLKKIGNKAFYQCTGLQQKQFYLPKTLKTIGDDAFTECSGLRGTLHLPQSLESIGDNAFLGCVGLDGNLTMHGNMSIGDDAFAATDFTSITFSDDNPMQLGSRIFALTSTIKTINFVNCDVTKIWKNWTYQPDSLFIDTPSTMEGELVVYVDADSTTLGTWELLLHSHMGLPTKWKIEKKV